MSLDLDTLITAEHKREMVDFLNGMVQEFKTTSVTESLVDFTENTRVLTSGTSARPGKYRFEVVPYMREITECLSEYSRIIELVLMKGTQIAGTEALLNQQVYCIKHGIGPVMYVTSDDDLAKEFMEKRTGPAIMAAGMQNLITPVVQKRSNKSSGDSKRAKSYAGTFLMAIGARSESKLSSVPIRVLQLDEIDKYPVVLVGGGSSIAAATRRTDSYTGLKKIVYMSTPKHKATSRIEPLFQMGDMRYYFIPCPMCGTMQRLKWSQIQWDKNKDGKLDIKMDEKGYMKNNPVWLQCENKDCSHKIRDYEKFQFMAEKGHGGKAEWRGSKQPDRPGMRSYHVNALYGFRSWIDVVIQWDHIEGDQDLLYSFITDVCAETFTQRLDKPDMHYLAARAETDFLRGDINQRIKILTAGVDVQDNRLEMSLLGWRDRKEAWSIQHYIFDGNTINPDDDCYNNLEETLRNKFYRPDGSEISISIALVDAAHHTQSVMNFCERFEYQSHNPNTVYPCFGKQTLSAIVREHKSTIATPEILLHDQRLKAEVYTNLKRKTPAAGHAYPPGFLHFPCDFTEDFYKQLTNEEVTEITNNKGVVSMMIANTKQRAVEVLDCHKMALAGLYFLFFKYFELRNVWRKSRKMKPLTPDWQYYWNLINEDEKKEIKKIKI